MSVKINQKLLLKFGKWIVVLCLAMVVYFQIFRQENREEITQMFLSQLSLDKWYYVALSIALMPLNWLLETIKWHKLVKQFEDISLWTASKAIAIGIVMAIITPARIGEYAGRLTVMREKSLSFGATFLGSVAQNIVTLLVGLLTIYFYLDLFTRINSTQRNVYYFIVTVVILVLFWIYYNLGIVFRWLQKTGYFSKFIIHLSHHNVYKNSLLNRILLLSFLRYVVYASQYYLLLLFFGIEADPEVMIAGIAILFLIQSGIPLPPVISIFARGELAILIWSNISENTIAALSVSFSLWIINLIIPALVGLIVLFNIKVRAD